MITDAQISEAAVEYEDILFKTVPDFQNCRHTFSNKFEKKMKRVIRRANHSQSYHILQRIACVVIAVILCGSLLLMFNTEVRATVIGWIKEQFSFFTGYFSDGNASGYSPKGYDIGWLPDGYALLDQTELPDGGVSIYVDGDGKILQFSYSYSTDESSFHIGEDGFIYRQIIVSGHSADLYLSSDPSLSNGLIWVGADGYVLFQITAHVDEELLIRIAESIYEIEKTN